MAHSTVRCAASNRLSVVTSASEGDGLASQVQRFSLLWRSSLLARNEPPPPRSASFALLSGRADAAAVADGECGRRANAFEQTGWFRAGPGDSVRAGLPLHGIGMLLALDGLQAPATAVRAASQRWLSDASASPHSLLKPLLTLLLDAETEERLRLYALSKLRVALSCMPVGTLSLLAKHVAPPELCDLCSIALNRVASTLHSGGAQLRRNPLVNCASSLLQVQTNASPRPVSA